MHVFVLSHHLCYLLIIAISHLFCRPVVHVPVYQHANVCDSKRWLMVIGVALVFLGLTDTARKNVSWRLQPAHACSASLRLLCVAHLGGPMMFVSPTPCGTFLFHSKGPNLHLGLRRFFWIAPRRTCTLRVGAKDSSADVCPSSTLLPSTTDFPNLALEMLLLRLFKCMLRNPINGADTDFTARCICAFLRELGLERADLTYEE